MVGNVGGDREGKKVGREGGRNKMRKKGRKDTEGEGQRERCSFQSPRPVLNPKVGDLHRLTSEASEGQSAMEMVILYWVSL
jgi:hypothetical protein